MTTTMESSPAPMALGGSDNSSSSSSTTTSSTNNNKGDEKDMLKTKLVELQVLLEQERDKTEQLTLKTLALEQDNNALRDEMSSLKKETLKHQLDKETFEKETRRTLATLQVELETSRKHVIFLEQEADELRAAYSKNNGRAAATSSVSANGNASKRGFGNSNGGGGYGSTSTSNIITTKDEKKDNTNSNYTPVVVPTTTTSTTTTTTSSSTSTGNSNVDLTTTKNNNNNNNLDDYQKQIQVLIQDKYDLLQDLDQTYTRNNNQAKLLKRLEAQMTDTKKSMEKQIVELQKSLAEERMKKNARSTNHNNNNNNSPMMRMNSTGSSSRSLFWGNSQAKDSIKSLPGALMMGDVEDHTTTTTTPTSGRERRQGRGGGRGASLSPARTRSVGTNNNTTTNDNRSLSPVRPGRNNSRLARLDGRSAMMRQQKDRGMSLRELLHEKRSQCDGKNKQQHQQQREMLRVDNDTILAATLTDSGNNNNNNFDKTESGWNADMLPDGGAIQQSAQASFLGAAVKKKQQQDGFWSKLGFGGGSGDDDDSKSMMTPLSTPTNSLEPSTNGGGDTSLLTREIMFNIKENERMMEERQKVIKAQEEARLILERERQEQEKLTAKQNVKQLKNAVNWGVFTMFSPISEGDDDDNDDTTTVNNNHRDSNASSIDTVVLQRLAAKRTEGMTMERQGSATGSYYSSSGGSSTTTSSNTAAGMMKRLSVMSDLSIPESIQESEDQ